MTRPVTSTKVTSTKVTFPKARASRCGLALLTLGLALVLVAVPTVSNTAIAQEKGKPAKDSRTPEERRAAAEKLFKKLDKNRNNSLSVDELPSAKPWLDRFDRNGDDVIRKKEMLTVIGRGPGLDRLFIVRDERARANNALSQFDQDKNGTVSAMEYPGNKNSFKRADRNKNDELEWKELIRMAADELDAIRKKMKSPSRYEFLIIFDLNGDRKISANEYDGPARTFRKFDTNSDGTVGYYELYPDRMMEMTKRKPAAEDMNIVGALDKNEDRRVSREEFNGTPAAWRRLDRNRDGWITSADAR